MFGATSLDVWRISSAMGFLRCTDTAKKGSGGRALLLLLRGARFQAAEEEVGSMGNRQVPGVRNAPKFCSVDPFL